MSDTVTVIGVLAMLVAAVGLYGVVSYVMGSRVREFGVRLALAATPSSIARLVLGYGMGLVVIGVAAGVVLGFAALRLISGVLFGSWNSGLAATIAGLLLSAVTLAACAIPAVRATAIAPVDALRAE